MESLGIDRMNMARKKSSSSTEGPSFEEALEELQGIVDQLDEGQLPLSDALQGFERGIHLYRVCSEILENAESKVEMLQSQLKGPGPEAIPLDSIIKSTMDSSLEKAPLMSSDGTEGALSHVPATEPEAPFDAQVDTDPGRGTEQLSSEDLMRSENNSPRPKAGLF